MSRRFDSSKLKFKTKKLEIGDTFYTYDGDKNHIIGFIEDGENKLVAYKFWIKHKGYWGYRIQLLESLLYSICLLYDIPKGDKRKELYEINDAYMADWM